MVEHSAVNRRVVSSSLTRGAENNPGLLSGFAFLREIKSMRCFLYILKSETNDIYYTGQSENPPKRLLFHNSIEKGFTARYRPWRIVFQQDFPDRKKAKAAKASSRDDDAC